MNTNKTRASSPAENAQYFRKLLDESTEENITRDLLQAVANGSVVPSTYDIWLGVSRSPFAVKAAWTQKFSLQVRQSGTKRLRKLLKSAQWGRTWEALGGTQGLLDLFSDFSVHEVRNVCLAISASAKGEDLKAKREKITELLKALLPRLFPESEYQNPDARPLFKLYQRLVPGCTPQFVTDVLNSKEDWKHFRNHFLYRSHPETLRELSLQTVFKDRKPGRPWLLALTGQHPSATGTYPRFSASIQFALEVLRLLAKEENSSFPEDDFIEDLIDPLLKRAIRKRIAWSYTKEILELAVQYLEKHPSAANDIDIRWGAMLSVAAICWSRQPAIFESSFASLLLIWKKTEDGQSVDFSSFWTLQRVVSKPRRYAVWRFCYKTVTGQDPDIEADLKAAEGPLNPGVLQAFRPEEALGLFTRLRNVGCDMEFVSTASYGGSVTGIPRSLDDQTGDPDILQVWLTHQVADARREQGQIEQANNLVAEAEQLARKNVQERKKKAMSSSDQKQRADHAFSTFCYAIASRSFPLYREVQEWGRRFVRDPLTVRASCMPLSKGGSSLQLHECFFLNPSPRIISNGTNLSRPM